MGLMQTDFLIYLPNTEGGAEPDGWIRDQRIRSLKAASTQTPELADRLRLWFGTALTRGVPPRKLLYESLVQIGAVLEVVPPRRRSALLPVMRSCHRVVRGRPDSVGLFKERLLIATVAATTVTGDSERQAAEAVVAVGHAALAMVQGAVLADVAGLLGRALTLAIQADGSDIVSYQIITANVGELIRRETRAVH